MRFGVDWFTHDEENLHERTTVHGSLPELFGALAAVWGAERVFTGLVEDAEDGIYWMTVDSGFGLHIDPAEVDPTGLPTPDRVPHTGTLRCGVRWYEGFGEHEYIEASSAIYDSLPKLAAALTETASEEEIFKALAKGRQVSIHWVHDSLGFELFEEE